MSATLTQGFQHNLISISGEKSHIYPQLLPFHSQKHCEKRSVYCNINLALSGPESVMLASSRRVYDNEPEALLHSRFLAAERGKRGRVLPPVKLKIYLR